ncbi:MAG: hypothetical protein ACRC8Y_19420, partial [Chroococcales cyanobacterium]
VPDPDGWLTPPWVRYSLHPLMLADSCRVESALKPSVLSSHASAVEFKVGNPLDVTGLAQANHNLPHPLCPEQLPIARRR